MVDNFYMSLTTFSVNESL